MAKVKKPKMQFSDYIRLGRISIKARKKSTRNTVFGMAFGLILLVPMIFFALSFYADLSKQVNSVRTAASLNVSLKNINDPSAATPYKEYSENSMGSEGLPAFSSYDDLVAIKDVEDYILSEYCNLSLYDLKLKLGEDFYDLFDDNGGGATFGQNKLKILFTEESTADMFTDAELEDFKKMTGKTSPFINACNDGFTKATKGKNEIILSEAILKEWDIEVEEVAYKNISILYPEWKLCGTGSGLRNLIDTDNIATNTYTGLLGEEWDDEKTYQEGDIVHQYGAVYVAQKTTNANPSLSNDWDVLTYQFYLCYEFKVVGILKDEYFEMPGKMYDSHIWVTSSSAYFEEGKYDYKPIDYQINAVENFGTVVTFEKKLDDVVALNTTQKYMMLMQGSCDRFNMLWDNEKYTYELNKMTLQMQIKDYSLMSNLMPQLKDILKAAYSDMDTSRFQSLVGNEIYNQFMMLNQIGTALIITFSAIGGIIFFANMLNLLNTVRYSVESRKNYLGVMRAIGAKSKIIPKLYTFEMLIIFFKTFIWVTIFGTLISVGIKLGLDQAFKYLEGIISLKVNLWYYPMTLGGAFLLTTLIGVFFANTSCKVIAYQPILKTLFDEK